MGTWVLWLKAHLELGQKETEVSNRYRSVLDLAAALNRGMTTIGEATDVVSNKKLADSVKTQLRGGAIKAVDPMPTATYTCWTWIKGHKGWVGVYLLTASWAVPWILMNLMVVGTSISVALSVGRTKKTRIVLFLCAFISSGLLIFPLLFVRYLWHYINVAWFG
jgi:hypothetical protein